MPCRAGRTQKRVVARAKNARDNACLSKLILDSYLSKGRKPASSSGAKNQEIFGTAFFTRKSRLLRGQEQHAEKSRETTPRGFFAWCEFNAAHARATLRDRG